MRNRKYFAWMGFFLLVGMILTPQTRAEEAHYPPAANRTVSFQKDIEPVLRQNCAKCHARGKAEGGFRMDVRDLVLIGSNTGRVVQTGDSQNSYLTHLISGVDSSVRMPPSGELLSEEQVGLIRAWIDQGLPWPDGINLGRFKEAELEPREVIVPAAKAIHSENPVDRLLESYFQKNEIEFPDRVDDRLFARRAYLDTIGLLPPPDQLEAFLEDDSPDKRNALVEDLLSRNQEYAENWITFWNDLLRNDFTGTGYIDGGRKQITDWLYHSLEANKPYNQFVHELVDPVTGSEGFIKGIVWRGVTNSSQTPAMQAAQNIGQVFMGINLKCASCHDSFISNWTLKDSYGLASVFSDDPLEIHRCDNPTGDHAPIKFLYEELGTVDPNLSRDRRAEQLANILTDEQNGRFARTFVNRLWARLLGHGLIEPNDEMDRDPWSKDILDWLATDFIENDFDVKHTLRVILTSKAYQLPSSSWNGQNDKNFVFTGPVVKRMTAEQFRDSLCAITNHWPGEPGTDLKIDNMVDGVTQTRSWMLKRDPFTVAMGRPNRDQINSQRSPYATTLQALELTNGSTLYDLLEQGAGRLISDHGQSKEELVHYLFFYGLGREATEAEKGMVLEMIGDEISAENVEDVLWSLAMLPEFQLIY
ncbi:MAG: PSD1 domain-containing protein [Candidatus Omnitrophica bacterium]|nr:PSD1 domain-containing protein [Candidatus Omnitrophota bacterium]